MSPLALAVAFPCAVLLAGALVIAAVRRRERRERRQRLRHPLTWVHPGEWDDDPQGASGDTIARLRKWQRDFDAEMDQWEAEWRRQEGQR